MIKFFSTFGKLKALSAIKILFWAGLVPLFIQSYIIGRYIYLKNTYLVGVESTYNGRTWYSDQPVNNFPLGVFGGIVSFLVLVLIWKIVCELLIIFFRYFESNTRRENE